MTALATGFGVIYRWQIESYPAGSGVWTYLGNGSVEYAGATVGTCSDATTNHVVFQHNGSNVASLRLRCVANNSCGSTTSEPAQLTIGPADVGAQGGVPGHDSVYDNNDFIIFIAYFFSHLPAADMGRQGGVAGADGQFDNNDFIVFIDQFFAGC